MQQNSPISRAALESEELQDSQASQNICFPYKHCLPAHSLFKGNPAPPRAPGLMGSYQPWLYLEGRGVGSSGRETMTGWQPIAHHKKMSGDNQGAFLINSTVMKPFNNGRGKNKDKERLLDALMRG